MTEDALPVVPGEDDDGSDAPPEEFYPIGTYARREHWIEFLRVSAAMGDLLRAFSGGFADICFSAGPSETASERDWKIAVGLAALREIGLDEAQSLRTMLTVILDHADGMLREDQDGPSWPYSPVPD